MRKTLVVLLALAAMTTTHAKRKVTTPATTRREAMSPLQQRKISYYYIEGVKQKLAGNMSAAHDLFAHCLAIDPTSPEALHELGYIQFYLGEDGRGVEMLERASALDPDNPWYTETLAAALLNAYEYDRATPVLERLAALQPKRTDIMQQLMEIYRAQGEWDKCLSALDRIELLDGGSISTSLQRYNLLLHMGRTEDAFATLNTLRHERRVDHDNPQLQLATLDYLRRTGQDSIRTAMRDSLIFAPAAHSEVRVPLISERVEELHSQGRTAEVVALVDSLAAMTRTAEMLTLRAVCFQFIQASDDSIATALRQVLEVDPSNQRATDRLLPYYMSRQDFAAAEEVCRMGINSRPENLVYHYYLGVALYQQHRLGECIEAFANGINQVDEDSPAGMVSDLYAVLGDSHGEAGDTLAAYAAYDQCLTYNANNAAALNNYAYYLATGGGDLAQAERMAARAVKLEPLNTTYLDTYAWVLYLSGNRSMARFYMGRVVRDGQDLPPEVQQHADVIFADDED